MKLSLAPALLFLSLAGFSQTPASQVNVFVGSSGDHGQMSPAASSPFGMLSIGPETYPKLHMGYEHKASIFLGFTHNRFEGVGCTGSGGNILVTPFTGAPETSVLKKMTENASPGQYAVSFTNGIKTSIVVSGNSGIENYRFPSTGRKGFTIDLSHTLSNRFVAEEHTIGNNQLSGWIESRTTCNAGTYRVYYSIQFNTAMSITDSTDHRLQLETTSSNVQLGIGFSAVDLAHAKANTPSSNAAALWDRQQSWNATLGQISVKGDPAEARLFYSLLYRTLQSPYLISEKDGSYRSTDGQLHAGDTGRYNGWAIWDNYRTQLPLLSLLYPDRYQGMINSIAGLYQSGKKDYATQTEPSNTVRTEHAIVVLLDAARKGYQVDFAGILDSLKKEVDSLDFTHPDKALESSYDTWAFASILDSLGRKTEAAIYYNKAAGWKTHWAKEFRDMSKNDVDRMGARGMYQGTVWQYRWLVPFDMEGLKREAGGEQEYIRQLDQFFNSDLYNHANETDIQAPVMYNITGQPWKSQDMVRRYAADKVVQYYFNDNSRGIDPFVGRIYTNKPDTYVRTMDDDAGAMSGWYVFAATGLMPACVGWPVYYISVPLFDEVKIGSAKTAFTILAPGQSRVNRYIQSITLDGKPLDRTWLTHAEISGGGKLVIRTGPKPNTSFGISNRWTTGQ
ncbi:MAG: alpha-mannosidase [Chitinophagaceae bacterium]|nr:MAG: alpha-mannosidase [Chitinophagaceae bacterium]